MSSTFPRVNSDSLVLVLQPQLSRLHMYENDVYFRNATDNLQVQQSYFHHARGTNLVSPMIVLLDPIMSEIQSLKKRIS